MKLTEYAHGGGCGCKISPSVLNSILKDLRPIVDENLLVGFDQADDAAVYQIDEDTAIVATTDFFTPIVDDPFVFGKIAATNALSDVYAMGATPLFALSVLGMPIDKLSTETISSVLKGGRAVCADVGIPIAGGHSIDTPEPIYGLVVIGKIDPRKIKRNTGARPGDSVILSKPIGVGVLSAALKKGLLTDAGYEEMITLTTQLNSAGASLGKMPDVHAMTDVTGFGLLGHLKELVVGSNVSAEISLSAIPISPTAVEFCREGVVTGASARNWASCIGHVNHFDDIDAFSLDLLTDPQTSGGLLITCSPSIEMEVLGTLKDDGFAEAKRIGHITSDGNQIKVIK